MRFSLTVCCVLISVSAATHAANTPPDAAAAPTAGGAVPSWNNFLELGNLFNNYGPEIARQAYDQQNFAAALPYYEVMHRIDPDDRETAKRFGFTLKETGRYEEAHDLLFQATVDDPADYFAWWWLSDTQRLLGDYKRSFESMLNARNAAPEDVRKNLQQYVDYTESLGTNARTWEIFEKHREFGRRHEKMRRFRRCIAEYMTALDTVPATGPGAFDTPLRIGWVNNQIGIQYNQLKEPAAALDHFWRAVRYYGEANSPSDVMMAYQNIGVTYNALADIDPARNTQFLELGAKYWGEALRLARELNDIPYTRYAQAGRLKCLALARGLEDAEVKEIRAANLLELPWAGPINEYTTAAVGLAELSCRTLEGDFAGARVVGDMIVVFYGQSDFLLDTEAAANIYLQLAQIHTRQEHYDTATQQARLAQDKLNTLRSYMDLDSFSRSSNAPLLRAIAVARVRAAILSGYFARAARVAEEYRLQARTDMLGSKITEDAARNDFVTEKELISRGLPLLEAELEAAKTGPALEEPGRLAARIEECRARLAWLDKGLRFASSGATNYRAIPALSPEELAASWPDDTQMITLLSDNFGSVAIVYDGTEPWGTLLPEASIAALAALAATVNANALAAPDAALPALDELFTRTLAPLKDRLTAKTLYFAVDGPLSSVPMELLRDGGAFLIAKHDIAYAASGSYLMHARGMAAPAAAALRVVCAGDGCAPLAALPGAVTCDTEICAAHAPEPAGTMFLRAPVDFAAPDTMLASFNLAPAGVYDGALHAAELLGAQAGCGTVWLAPQQGAAAWNPEAMIAFEEGFLQAGVPNIVRPLAPLSNESVDAFIQKVAAAGPISGRAVIAAKRAALEAAPTDLAPAYILFSGPCN